MLANIIHAKKYLDNKGFVAYLDKLEKEAIMSKEQLSPEEKAAAKLAEYDKIPFAAGQRAMLEKMQVLLAEMDGNPFLLARIRIKVDKLEAEVNDD